jgi:hypothetical protein
MIADDMDRLFFGARKHGRLPTHWLMSRDALDDLRISAAAVCNLIIDPQDQRRRYRGLPIYVDPSMLGWAIQYGPVNDRALEIDLREQLEKLATRYHEAARPIIEQLSRIEARKSPPRIVVGIPMDRPME